MKFEKVNWMIFTSIQLKKLNGISERQELLKASHKHLFNWITEALLSLGDFLFYFSPYLN